jgi:hypothetical protein
VRGNAPCNLIVTSSLEASEETIEIGFYAIHAIRHRYVIEIKDTKVTLK